MRKDDKVEVCACPEETVATFPGHKSETLESDTRLYAHRTCLLIPNP